MDKLKIGDKVRRVPGKVDYAGWPMGSNEVTVIEVNGSSVKFKGLEDWWSSYNFVLSNTTRDENNFYVAVAYTYNTGMPMYELHGPMSLEDARKRAKAISIGGKALILTGVEEITATRSFETKVLN